jgi:hypothetical protein
MPEYLDGLLNLQSFLMSLGGSAYKDILCVAEVEVETEFIDQY